MFQSPDGDSVVSHEPASRCSTWPGATFQSPDGDSVVSHIADITHLHSSHNEFQSPDGDSVVSHTRVGAHYRVCRQCAFQSPDGDSVVSHCGYTLAGPIQYSCFSPLTGIPWFPTRTYLQSPIRRRGSFQSPDGDSVVSHPDILRTEPHEDRSGFSPLTGIPWFPT